MNRLKHLTCLAIALLASFGTSLQARTPSPVVVAYVISWSHQLPDPSLMTHINYAFGHVSADFKHLTVQNPDRLRQIVALKRQNPKLRVVLSVGGWGAGHFSEMAASETNRRDFVQSCALVVRYFGLDGIDIDWEYPTSGVAGISSAPGDSKNLTLLLRDLRQALGRGKVVSVATVAEAKFIDWAGSLPYLDFVNAMAYDMGTPPHHHASLYPSPHATYSCQQSIDAHLAAGVPAGKLVLGMPIYARGKRHQDPVLRDYARTGSTGGRYTERWDSIGQVPYLADSTGTLVLG